MRPTRAAAVTVALILNIAILPGLGSAMRDSSLLGVTRGVSADGLDFAMMPISVQLSPVAMAPCTEMSA